MSFFENTRKPVGLWREAHGRHDERRAQCLWHGGDFNFWSLLPDAKVLDCGCGGGANMKRLLKKCPQGVVKGIDYSPVSVEKSKKVNEAAISGGTLHRSARQRGGYDLCRRLVRCGHGL